MANYIKYLGKPCCPVPGINQDKFGYVQIGNTLWTTMNFGATSETDPGLYYQLLSPYKGYKQGDLSKLNDNDPMFNITDIIGNNDSSDTLDDLQFGEYIEGGKLQLGDNQSGRYPYEYSVYAYRTANILNNQCTIVEAWIYAPSKENLTIYDWFITNSVQSGRILDENNNNNTIYFENSWTYSLSENSQEIPVLSGNEEVEHRLLKLLFIV